jgi:hypothetical protein
MTIVPLDRFSASISSKQSGFQIFEFQDIIEFLKDKCNWNDFIVRQFLATMEIDFDEEIEWMTQKRQYRASFVESCTTNKLDSNFYTKKASTYGECGPHRQWIPRARPTPPSSAPNPAVDPSDSSVGATSGSERCGEFRVRPRSTVDPAYGSSTGAA